MGMKQKKWIKKFPKILLLIFSKSAELRYDIKTIQENSADSFTWIERSDRTTCKGGVEQLSATNIASRPKNRPRMPSSSRATPERSSNVGNLQKFWSRPRPGKVRSRHIDPGATPRSWHNQLYFQWSVGEGGGEMESARGWMQTKMTQPTVTLFIFLASFFFCRVLLYHYHHSFFLLLQSSALFYNSCFSLLFFFFYSFFFCCIPSENSLGAEELRDNGPQSHPTGRH